MRYAKKAGKGTGEITRSMVAVGLPNAILALFCALVVTGCFPGSKPPYAVQLYTLQYPARSSDAAMNIGEVVKIGRFSVAQSYNTSSMLSTPEPYRITAYNYHKWQTNPGDMVTDRLVADFRSSGLFRAVFSYRDPGDYRFMVDGGVDEFVQARTNEGWRAILSVHVNLIDLSQTAARDKVLWQRHYEGEIPLAQQSPDNFASGMSEAMSKISAEILRDVQASITAASGNGQNGQVRH